MLNLTDFEDYYHYLISNNPLQEELQLQNDNQLQAILYHNTQPTSGVCHVKLVATPQVTPTIIMENMPIKKNSDQLEN